jgi:hypothetical protein
MVGCMVFWNSKDWCVPAQVVLIWDEIGADSPSGCDILTKRHSNEYTNFSRDGVDPSRVN